MQREGVVQLGPYARGSKSARAQQVFLMLEDGRRLVLRRLDGPPMVDAELEALTGHRVRVEGVERDDHFLVRDIQDLDVDRSASGRAERALRRRRARPT